MTPHDTVKGLASGCTLRCWRNKTGSQCYGLSLPHVAISLEGKEDGHKRLIIAKRSLKLSKIGRHDGFVNHGWYPLLG